MDQSGCSCFLLISMPLRAFQRQTMREMNPFSSQETTDQSFKQPNRFFLAVLLTGILYYSAGLSQPQTTRTSSVVVQPETLFSSSVAHAVLLDVSERANLPASQLHILQIEPHWWQDECSNRQRTDLRCRQQQKFGWQVIVASHSQRWIYHTNPSGSVLKLYRTMDIESNVVVQRP
jgi:hypothetical protein